MSFVANIEKFVPDLKQRKILDLGCGRGDDLIELVKYGYDAVGLDVNMEYLNIVREKAKVANLAVKLIKAQAESLPIPKESFDFVILSEVTEHVEDPEKLLKECYRVLRPGGKVYASFHNRFGPYDHHYHLWFINWLPRFMADEVLDLIGKAKGEDKKAGRQKLSQMHYFTYKEARGLIEKCNFKCFDMREEQVLNPVLSSRKLLKVASSLKLAKPLLFGIKNFIGTFHFILTK